MLADDYVGCLTLLGVSLVIGILLIAWVITEPPRLPEVITVKHDEFNFVLDHPSKYVSTLYDESGYHGNHDIRLILSKIFYLAGQPETFVIRVESRTINNPSLQDVVKWSDEGLENLSSNFGFEDISLEETELNGQPIMRRLYSTQTVKYEEVLIPRSKDMFIITLIISKEYFNEYHADFNRIVESFRPLE